MCVIRILECLNKRTIVYILFYFTSRISYIVLMNVILLFLEIIYYYCSNCNSNNEIMKLIYNIHTERIN